jgi:hypothetical protein
MTIYPYSLRPSLQHERAGALLVGGRTISYFHSKSVDPLAQAALDRFTTTGELTGAVRVTAEALPEGQPHDL